MNTTIDDNLYPPLLVDKLYLTITLSDDNNVLKTWELTLTADKQRGQYILGTYYASHWFTCDDVLSYYSDSYKRYYLKSKWGYPSDSVFNPSIPDMFNGWTTQDTYQMSNLSAAMNIGKSEFTMIGLDGFVTTPSANTFILADRKGVAMNANSSGKGGIKINQDGLLVGCGSQRHYGSDWKVDYNYVNLTNYKVMVDPEFTFQNIDTVGYVYAYKVNPITDGQIIISPESTSQSTAVYVVLPNNIIDYEDHVYDLPNGYFIDVLNYSSNSVYVCTDEEDLKITNT